MRLFEWRAITPEQREQRQRERDQAHLAYHLARGSGGVYTPSRPFDFERLPLAIRDTLPERVGKIDPCSIS